MINRTFWQWAAGVLIFVLLYAFVPGKARLPLLLMLFLGGVIVLERYGGGLDKLLKTIRSGGKG